MKKIILSLLTLFLCSISASFSQAPDTLRVGYNLVPPFISQSAQGLEGPSVWLWENIAEENNIAFVYRRLPLDSLLSGLTHHEIDICLSPLTITSERSKVMEFTAPYYIAQSTMLKRSESTLTRAWKFVKSFFSVNFMRALGALAFVILIFGILIWLFERNQNKEEFSTGLKGMWEGFWWSAVTMTTVGYGDKSPQTAGGRIVALVWMFTAIIIISGFTASIASSLTVNQISSSNSAINDFKDKNLGTIRNSATSEWLKNNFFTKKKKYNEMEEMLEALDQEEIDFVAYDRPILRTLMARDTLSRYDLIDVKYNPQFYAFGMSKDLPEELIDQINISMLGKVEKIDWRILLSEYDLE